VPVARGDEYDPLRIPAAFKPEHADLTVKDATRSREIPIRVHFPVAREPAPVVLFSHGLGGSRENAGYLANHWTGRGYVVVVMQHPGSDEAVWRDAPLALRRAALQKAAGLENFQLRAKDVPAVLDQLERWNAEEGHPLNRRLDVKRVGMSGHSFGAVTTQAVSGQRFPLGANLTEARIKAAVAMSPSVPRVGDPARAFGEVKVPWLLLTGTLDDSPIGDTEPADRLKVFPALPAGSKYELVLEKARHSAFSDRLLPGDRGARNPNHHKKILALTTAFWDAYLRDDAGAKTWLDGEGPRSMLEPADSWKRKSR
jgi:predicted dienelactone hydrolase